MSSNPEAVLYEYRQLCINIGRGFGVSECLDVVISVLSSTTQGEDWLRDHRSDLDAAVQVLRERVKQEMLEAVNSENFDSHN